MIIFFTYQSYSQISDFKPINFKEADYRALLHKDETITNLPELSYKLTTSLSTDVERFRAIYIWVCHNIANDYHLYLKNKNKRERFANDSVKLDHWNTSFRGVLFKKLKKNKRTICTGYAYLVKVLSRLANLECEIVQGYGRVSTTDTENLTLPNHSWIAIKLNNKWYLCDPTWASGMPNPKTHRFTFEYNDGLFLAHPELFAINHYPIDERWWLLDDYRPTLKEFLASPIIYNKAYKNLKLHKFPKQMHQTIKKDDSIDFEYQLKKSIEYDDLTLYIDSGYNNWRIKPSSAKIVNGNLTFEHQFNKVGFYDVHFYIKNDLISTYTFKVNP